MTQPSDNKSYDFTDIIQFLLRWSKHLIIITFLAAVVAAVVSFMITPKYRSTVIFYPTTTNSISIILEEIRRTETDPLEFGEDVQAEQALQILNSSLMTSKIVETYDLMKHYEIDPNSSYPYTKLSREIKENISFRRTEYMSIEISVLDKDPAKAAEIANGIANLLDSAKTEIQRKVAKQNLYIVEQKFKEKQEYVDQLNDSLIALGRKGIYNFEEQSTSLSEQHLIAISKNDKRVVEFIEAQLRNLAEYGSAQSTLYQTLLLEIESLNHLRTIYERIRTDAEANLAHKFIISAAGVSEQKAYPIRSVIVLSSAAAAFLLACIGFVLYENRSAFKLRKRNIDN
jgi:capsular polysaccharide biosynthesis protein